MQGTLSSVLTYHVVADRFDGAANAALIKAGCSKAMIKTVHGGSLTARMCGNGILLIDSEGVSANVTTSNVYQGNGVIHVIDSVLMP